MNVPPIQKERISPKQMKKAKHKQIVNLTMKIRLIFFTVGPAHFCEFWLIIFSSSFANYFHRDISFIFQEYLFNVSLINAHKWVFNNFSHKKLYSFHIIVSCPLRFIEKQLSVLSESLMYRCSLQAVGRVLCLHSYFHLPSTPTSSSKAMRLSWWSICHSTKN